MSQHSYCLCIIALCLKIRQNSPDFWINSVSQSGFKSFLYPKRLTSHAGFSILWAFTGGLYKCAGGEDNVNDTDATALDQLFSIYLALIVKVGFLYFGFTELTKPLDLSCVLVWRIRLVGAMTSIITEIFIEVIHQSSMIPLYLVLFLFPSIFYLILFQVIPFFTSVSFSLSLSSLSFFSNRPQPVYFHILTKSSFFL